MGTERRDNLQKTIVYTVNKNVSKSDVDTLKKFSIQYDRKKNSVSRTGRIARGDTQEMPTILVIF